MEKSAASFGPALQRSDNTVSAKLRTLAWLRRLEETLGTRHLREDLYFACGGLSDREHSDGRIARAGKARRAHARSRAPRARMATGHPPASRAIQSRSADREARGRPSETSRPGSANRHRAHRR